MKLFDKIFKKSEIKTTIEIQKSEPVKEKRAAKQGISTVKLFASPVYHSINNAALYSMYQNVEQVKSIINKLKDKYVSIPFLVQNKRGETIKNEQISKLFNPIVLEQLFLEYLILGNCYVNFTKSTKNFIEYIQTMPGIFTIADVANINDLINAQIIKYEINVGKRQQFEEKDVFHFKTSTIQNSTSYNPYGESNLSTATKSITVLGAIYDSLVTIFEKRGALGILSSKSPDYPIENPEELLQSYYNKYGYGADKHGIMITSASLEYTNMALPVRDLLPIEIKDSEFRELCKLFNISSVLFSDNSSSTYNNFETASKTFINDNVKPFLTNFYSQLSKKLDTDFVLVPDFTEQNESLKDIKLLNEIYNLMYTSGVVTGNEWRQINNLPIETQYNGNKQITDTTNTSGTK